MDKLNFTKIENFCFVKGPVKRMKRQVVDWKIQSRYLTKDLYLE